MIWSRYRTSFQPWSLQVNAAIRQRAQSQPSNIPTGTDIIAFFPKAISTVYGLTGPMLEDAATAASEDEEWAALVPS